MPKKRFSLLIEEDTPIKEQPGTILKDKKDTNVKPTLSLFDKKEEKNIESIPFKRKLNYWLIQKKTQLLHRTYGVFINYNDQKSTQYLLEVKCEGFKKGIFNYVLTRKQFFKDGKQLEGFMEQLAEQSANCLYPLKVAINTTGEIINVSNQKEIECRWEEKQKELLKRYKGKPFLDHCNKITKAVKSSDAILKSLRNDVIYDILFSKLYFNYTNKFTQPLEREFKWFSGVQKIYFEGNQSINPILKENGRMLINYKGVMKPVNTFDQGNISIKHELHAKDHTVLRIDGKFKYTRQKINKTIDFKIIWQEDMDKTAERTIEFNS